MVNLALAPSLRLMMGVGWTGRRESPTYCLALQVDFGDGPTTLAQVTVPFAQDAESVSRVANAALKGGTLDEDLARTSEAFKLFQNDAKLKGSVLEDTAKEASELIKAYWKIRSELEQGGPEEELRLDLPDKTRLTITA